MSGKPPEAQLFDKDHPAQKIKELEKDITKMNKQDEQLLANLKKVEHDRKEAKNKSDKPLVKKLSQDKREIESERIGLYDKIKAAKDQINSLKSEIPSYEEKKEKEKEELRKKGIAGISTRKRNGGKRKKTLRRK